MKNPFSEKNLHTLFDVGIIVKIIDSVGEILLGIMALFVTASTMHNILGTIFGDELNEVPLKNLWDFTLQSITQLSNNSQAFLATIFLSHGIIKLVLIIGLAKNKLWVYPLAAIAFTAFGVYQIYQIIFSPSAFLIMLTILDAIFVLLIIHEYQYQRKGRL